MVRHGETTFDWGDGPHTFRLGIAEWRELQSKTKVGPPELYLRINTGKWLIDDCPEIIRLGLIGGGSDPLDALRLIEFYCYERAPFMSVRAATQIMTAALFPPDEPEADQKKSEDQSAATETAESHFPSFTGTVQ